MKASGGLTYVTGPMGSGKSLFGTRKMADAFFSGKYVITNVQLKPGWAERIARHTPQVMMNPLLFRKRVRLYESLYIYTHSLEQATAFRVPGKKESRALIVWDEAHNDMNNREWMAENNKYIIKWATQLRKLGFAAYLLSQHRDNTDAALRRIANFEVRLRNQRESVRVLGMKVSPVPFFLAIWYPANMPKVVRGDNIIHIERYFLTWHKKLYDTLDLYHGLDEDISSLYEQVVLLPKPGTWSRAMLEGRVEDNSLIIETPEHTEQSPMLPIIEAKSRSRREPPNWNAISLPDLTPENESGRMSVLDQGDADHSLEKEA